MSPVTNFRHVVRVLLACVSIPFATRLVAQSDEGPRGVLVKIWGAATGNNTPGEQGDLEIYNHINFLPRYPDANDGDFYVSGSGGPSGFLTTRGTARLEPGKAYEINLTGTFISTVALNAVPPGGYDMEIEGVTRTRIQLGANGSYNASMRIRVLPKGGGFSGRAGVSSTLGSGRINWQVALGSLTSGGSAGAVALVDAGVSDSWTNVFTPAGLQYETTTSEVYVHRVSGAIRQIIAPQVAVDVVTLSSTSYELQFFDATQIQPGTTYPRTLTGQPYVTYRVEPGDTSTTLKVTSFTRNVTSTTATNVPVTRTTTSTLARSDAWPTFRWTLKDWTDATPLAEDVRTGTGTTADRVESRTLSVPGGDTVLAVGETFHLNPWGEELASETVGSSHPSTNSYLYYADATAPGSYAQVKSVTTNGGAWEAYEYYDAASNDRHTGRLRYRYRPFNSSPATAAASFNPALGESTYYEYVADAFGMLTRLSLSETKVKNATTAKTVIAYAAPATVNGMAVVAATRTNYTSATGTLTTITKFYQEDVADAFFRSQIHSVQEANGVMRSMAYQRGTWSSGAFTLSGNGGLDAGTASRITTIVGSATTGTPYTTHAGYDIDDIRLVSGKSTMEVTIRNSRGLVARTELHAWVGSWVQVAASDFTYNMAGQLASRTDSHGVADSNPATYSASYDGELKTSETDTSGITVSYTYDAAGRIETTKRAASGDIKELVTKFAYDAANHVTKRTVGWEATNLLETIVTSWGYDTAGRLASETPAGLGAINYGYDPAARTRTRTAADGGTVTWTQQIDSQLEKIDGTGVVGKYFTYDVLSDGRRTTQVDEGSLGSARWRKSWTDWVGRPQHTERVGFTGQPAFAEDFWYDASGRLLKLERTGYRPEHFEYDELSQLKRRGLSIGHQDAPLDPAGSDRITDYDRKFESWNGAYWLRNETTIYPTASSNTGYTSFSRRRLTGFTGTLQAETRFTDLEGNVQVSAIEVDPSTQTVTAATTRSGFSGSETRVSTSGFPTSVQGHDGLSTSLHYDRLGRLSYSTDSRSNSTTTGYTYGTDLVKSVTDGAGNAVTTLSYYNTGLVATRQDAVNRVSYFAYNARGQLTRQWGADYPVEYGYDATFGDRITQQTFRGGSGWSAGNWPANPGSADWTRWVYDGPSGFLKEKYDALNLDSSGNPITAGAKKVAYTYNSRGQVETRILARSAKTTYGYDGETGELLSQTYDDGLTPGVGFTYTRAGQLDSATDVTGTRDFVYDPAKPWRLSAEGLPAYFNSRLVTELYQESASTDVVGRSRGFKVGSSATLNQDLEQTYAFTTAGRFDTIATARSTNAVSRTFKYAYRADAALLSGISVVGESDFVVSRDYEAHRDLLTKVDSKWGTSSTASRTCYEYVYYGDGRRYTAKQSGLAFEDFGGSTYYRYTYTPRGEVATAADYLSETLPGLDQTPDVNTQLPSRHFAYVYDNQGNRQSSSRNGTAGLDTYTPTAANQYQSRTNNYARAAGTAASTVTSVSVTGGGLGWITSTPRGRYWAADAQVDANSPASRANLTIMAAITNGAGAGTDLVKVDTTRTAVTAPQTQSFAYDDDGNLTSDAAWTYLYDAENRLIRMTSTHPSGFTHLKLEFAYDYLGRRVEKKVTNLDSSSLVTQRRYLYDGWNLVAELTGDGTGVVRSYTWGLDIAGTFSKTGEAGALLQITDHTSGNRYLPTYDGNGNVASLVNAATGEVAIAYEYSPFGELLRAGAPTANSAVDTVAADNAYRFATKFTDPETGLIYYGNRFYSPTLGRFLNRDPIEEAGGMNLYGFCGNDGVNGRDLLGMGEEAIKGHPSTGDAVGFGFGGPRDVFKTTIPRFDDFNRVPYRESRKTDVDGKKDKQVTGQDTGPISSAEADREHDIVYAARLLSWGFPEEEVQKAVYLMHIGRAYQRESDSATSDVGKVAVFLKHWILNDPAAQILAAEAGGTVLGAARARVFGSAVEESLAGGAAEEASTGPIRAREVTTMEDFVERSVVGDKIEGHEPWQHANLKANDLAGERMSTEASRKNPVIALDQEVHRQVNAAQRSINAKAQTPVENIRANIQILRDLNVASEQALQRLKKLAEEHASKYGYD